MKLETTADGKVVLASMPKFVLADMIAQCDLKAPPPADLALCNVAQPVGGEVL
ncbi:MAG: MazE protein [Alphaproteobacteria bacterium]|nr:MazE protein [Alphaproteobacteria bacterium]